MAVQVRVFILLISEKVFSYAKRVKFAELGKVLSIRKQGKGEGSVQC